MARIKQAPKTPLKNAKEALEAYDRFAIYTADSERAWGRHSWRPATATGDKERVRSEKFSEAAEGWGKALRKWIKGQI